MIACTWSFGASDHAVRAPDGSHEPAGGCRRARARRTGGRARLRRGLVPWATWSRSSCVVRPRPTSRDRSGVARGVDGRARRAPPGGAAGPPHRRRVRRPGTAHRRRHHRGPGRRRAGGVRDRARRTSSCCCSSARAGRGTGGRRARCCAKVSVGSRSRSRDRLARGDGAQREGAPVLRARGLARHRPHDGHRRDPGRHVPHRRPPLREVAARSTSCQTPRERRQPSVQAVAARSRGVDDATRQPGRAGSGSGVATAWRGNTTRCWNW